MSLTIEISSFEALLKLQSLGSGAKKTFFIALNLKPKGDHSMKIGMMYAMDGEIESLLKNENAHLIEKVSGASFYQIRENIVACAGGVGKVNTAMSTQLLISRYAPDRGAECRRSGLL